MSPWLNIDVLKSQSSSGVPWGWSAEEHQNFGGFFRWTVNILWFYLILSSRASFCASLELNPSSGVPREWPAEEHQNFGGFIDGL